MTNGLKYNLLMLFVVLAGFGAVLWFALRDVARYSAAKRPPFETYSQASELFSYSGFPWAYDLLHDCPGENELTCKQINVAARALAGKALAINDAFSREQRIAKAAAAKEIRDVEGFRRGKIDSIWLARDGKQELPAPDSLYRPDLEHEWQAFRRDLFAEASALYQMLRKAGWLKPGAPAPAFDLPEDLPAYYPAAFAWPDADPAEAFADLEGVKRELQLAGFEFSARAREHIVQPAGPRNLPDSLLRPQLREEAETNIVYVGDTFKTLLHYFEHPIHAGTVYPADKLLISRGAAKPSRRSVNTFEINIPTTPADLPAGRAVGQVVYDLRLVRYTGHRREALFDTLRFRKRFRAMRRQ